MTTLVWNVIGGDIVRRGRPAPRVGLVYGTYEPEAGSTFGQNGVTAGLINAAALTDYNASSTQTVTLTNGETITDKTIHGDIRLPATHTSNITLTNCRLRGGPHIPSNNDAVVKADNTRTGTGRLIMTDCEIDPQTPALNRDGIRGNRFELYRPWIHDVIDGVRTIATTAQNSGNAYCYVYGGVIERLRYGYPDYDNGVSGAAEHGDGTHNDGVVVSGGKNVTIKGNLIRATSVHLPGSGNSPTHPRLHTVVLPDGTNHAHGQGLLFTNEAANPSDATVVVEENWFYGGLAQVMVSANTTAILRNNRHYREVYVDPGPGNTSSGYWIRYNQRSGNGVVANNSTWMNGPYQGDVLIEPRDLGIDFVT